MSFIRLTMLAKAQKAGLFFVAAPANLGATAPQEDRVKSLYTCLAAALLTMLSVGCSSSSMPAATSTGAVASCKTYCNKVGTSCTADSGTSVDYPSAAACITDLCDTLAANTLPAKCDSSTAAWFDCLSKQTNICSDTSCTAQFNQAATDCPTN